MHTPKNGSTIVMAPYPTVHDMLVGMQFHLQSKPWKSIGRFTVGGESFGVMYDEISGVGLLTDFPAPA